MAIDVDSLPYLVLYDGVCGLCNRTVQFLIRHDKQQLLFYCALQSEYAQQLLLRFPSLAGIDSVVFVRRYCGKEEAFVRSSAALELARYLGGWWKLALVGYLIPRSIRDALYNFVATHRYKWFGKYTHCMLPPPEVRSRFPC